MADIDPKIHAARIGPAAFSVTGRAAIARPYKPRPDHASDADEIREDIGTAIAGVEPMLAMLARRRFDDAELADEMVQRARMHIWRHAIPSFDATRGVKLSTYLYSCISRFYSTEARKLATVLRRSVQLPADHRARDESVDRQIEAIASDVRARPAHYLSRTQADAFHAADGRTLKAAAKLLGYRQPSSLSTILTRVRDRVARLVDHVATAH